MTRIAETTNAPLMKIGQCLSHCETKTLARVAGLAEAYGLAEGETLTLNMDSDSVTIVMEPWGISHNAMFPIGMKPDELRGIVAKAMAKMALDIARRRGESRDKNSLPQPWNCYANKDLAIAVRAIGQRLVDLHQAIKDSWNTVEHQGYHQAWNVGKFSASHGVAGNPGIDAGQALWSGMRGKVERNWPRREPQFVLTHLDLGGGTYFTTKRNVRQIVLNRVLSDSEVEKVENDNGLYALAPHPFVLARLLAGVSSIARTKKTSRVKLKRSRSELDVRMAPIPDSIHKIARTMAGGVLAAAGITEEIELQLTKPTRYNVAIEEADLVVTHAPLAGATKIGVDMRSLADSMKRTFLDCMAKDEDPWPALAQEAVTLLDARTRIF